MASKTRASASVRAFRRNALNRSSALGALALACALPQAALAQDECGVATGDTVTCTSAGNPYPNGIFYVATPPQDLTVVLEPDVVVDTSGTFGIGVLVVAGGAGNSVTVSGDTGASITTTDDFTFGVLVGSTDGDATANLSSVVTTGYGSTAVSAFSDTGDSNVSVGTVYTYGDGARGVYASTGTGTINATGFTVVTNGANAAGFDLQTQNGDVNLTLARSIFAGTVLTYGDGSAGVVVNAGGPGNVLIQGPGAGGFGSAAVVTQGAGATGVLANAQAGNIVIDLSQVQTTGAGSDAIVATSAGGSVNINVSTVTANDGRGIVATGATGATVTQSGNFIATGGDGHTAVQVTASGGPAAANIGNASTSGAYSRGVDVLSTGGTATASVGAVTTSGYASGGVFVRGATGASATGSSIRTYGDYSDAVNVAAVSGPVSVTNDGDVRTTGFNSFGIYASGTGAVTVSGTGSVSTTGALSSGVDARSSGGPVVVTTGNVSTTGATSVGVVARSTGGTASVTTGNVSTTGTDSIAVGALGTSASVTTNGTVTRTGATGPLSPAAAVGVQGLTGTATANVGTVTASGAGLDAVALVGATTASATVRAGGVVTGTIDAIDITSGTGSTVNNAGTLNTGTGYAIRATGGAVAVTNSGVINGRVLLTGGNDSINNTGTFNATQASDFGAGNDVFTNAGTFNASSVTDLGAGNDSFVNGGTFNANAGGGLNFNTGTDSFTNVGLIRILAGTTTAGTISFTGLESFANSGTIDLRNGHVGDVFSLGSSTFTGSGGSTLALDVSLSGTIAADRLTTGAATGSTQLVLANLSTGTLALNPGLLLVQGASGSSAGAFTLAGGPLEAGFASYSIVYNATDFGYRLVGAPSQSAFRTLKLVEGVRNLWYKSADAWSGHMTALRDAAWRADDGAEPLGSGLWLQMYGSTNTRRNGSRDFTVFGATSTADLGYQQDAFGGQIGFDFGAPSADGGLVFGVTGGYLNSTQGFEGTPDRVNIDAVNGGVYASYVSGSFFANALGKYDHYWVGSRLGGVGNNDDVNANAYGAQAEAGIRFGGDSFFAEPVASIAYVRTDMDELNAPAFLFSFDEEDGLRGKAGLRIGGSFGMGASQGLFYASGMAVHEFEGEDGVTLTSGGQTLNFRNDRIGTYGQGTIGVNVTTPGGVTGFIEAYGDYGDDYRGGGGRAGLRLRF